MMVRVHPFNPSKRWSSTRSQSHSRHSQRNLHVFIIDSTLCSKTQSSPLSNRTPHLNPTHRHLPLHINRTWCSSAKRENLTDPSLLISLTHVTYTTQNAHPVSLFHITYKMRLEYYKIFGPRSRSNTGTARSMMTMVIPPHMYASLFTRTIIWISIRNSSYATSREGCTHSKHVSRVLNRDSR